MATCDNVPLASQITEFSADMAFVQTFVETSATTAVTPQGKTRRTIAGIEAAADAALASTGLFPVAGSFEAGGTINERNQYLQLVTTAGGDIAGAYTWGGALPKTVASGSTPTSTGGKAPNAWVYRSDATLRSDLAAADSSVLVAGLLARKVAANAKRINADNYSSLVVGNCWAAAIEAAAADALVSGIGYSVIWLNDKTYGLSRAPILNASYRLDANMAELKANADFVASVVPTTSGTTTINHLLIFLLGNYNDISGPQRESAAISKGITLNCADKTANGLYIERMPYSNIDCKVINTLVGGTAIDVGPYCWGTKLNGVVIEDFAGNGITLGVGANGIEISSPRIWGKSKNGVSGIFLRAGADCNGVAITGGFIEKLAHGLYVSRNNGPISVSGTDFEICTSNCIIADGVIGDSARPIVNASGCYFDSSNIELTAIGGDIIADGCRFRAGINASTGAGGYIELNNCQYETDLPTLATGSNVAVDIEQEFTPTITDSSLSGNKGQTYASRKAVFVRRKNQVFFDISVVLSSLGTLTLDDGVRIGGLPFTPKLDNLLSSVSVGYFSGASLSGGKSALTGYISDEIPAISLVAGTQSGVQSVKISEITSSFRIDVSGSYFI